jgi:hypothetical protein
MEEEELLLLIKDLCARTPYSPIVNIDGEIKKLIAISNTFIHFSDPTDDYLDGNFDLDYCIVKDDYRRMLENGNSFKVENLVNEAPADEQDFVEPDKLYSDGCRVRVYSEDGTFFGIYKYNARTKLFNVDKFFFEK